MKQPEQTKEEKTANHFKEWLNSKAGLHCLEWPISEPRYLENRLWWAFTAGEDYASQKCKALQEENERLKKDLAEWREHAECRQYTVNNQRDRIQVLEEALREARTFITEADDDGEGKEDWIILKTIDQALTGSQSKD